MSNFLATILKAWEQRTGPAVFTTVDAVGNPNAVYVGSVWFFDEQSIIIADNYFYKTRANVLGGSSGSLLFITTDGPAYQLKGRLEYHTDGEYFRAMKQSNPDRHPGHAAVVLIVDEVYSGSTQLL